MKFHFRDCMFMEHVEHKEHYSRKTQNIYTIQQEMTAFSEFALNQTSPCEDGVLSNRGFSGILYRSSDNISAKSVHNLMTIHSLSSSDDTAESNPDIPYVVERASLPDLTDGLRTCSSQSIDVSQGTHLMDEVVSGADNAVLKTLEGVDLLRSSRPARCCRKAVLNGTKHGYIPYAASLRSLPLTERDVSELKSVIRSKMVCYGS